LGAFIQGFEVAGRRFAGGTFDWLTPFALFCGCALIAGYALLGGTWLIMKTEDHLQGWAYRLAIPLLAIVLSFIAAVSLWTPVLDPTIAHRWFSWPNIAFLSPVPLLTALVAIGIYRAVRRGFENQPFVLSIILFLLSYGGLAISLFPNIVPPDISIWQASAAPQSQLFLLYGTVPIIPIILAYTAHSYYVFRGKVRHDEGYH
jgi:cytochrome d ubiquinol oxidase subunit II